MPTQELTKPTQAMPNRVIPAGQEHRYRQGEAVTSDFLQMKFDESRMYIEPLIITNGSEDRDGEVIDPSGIIDTEYRRNPLVFFNHSHKFDPSIYPVGTSETPERKYQCMRQGDVWVSGCRFTKAAKIGEQVFALVLDGVIRGRSIGGLTHDMVPYKPATPGKAIHQGRIVSARPNSVKRTLLELVEWSWVPIQSNRDVVTAVKSILSRGRYNGQSLDPGVKMAFKSLDLREPETSSKNGRSTPHSLCGWAAITKGFEMSDAVPVAVRFDTKHFNPVAARQFLQERPELFLDTELSVENVDGRLCLRSTQLRYDGEIEAVHDDRLPGVELLCVKAGFFGKSEEVEEEPEGDGKAGIVQQILEDAEKQTVAVQEGGEKPPEEKPAEEAAIVAAKAMSGPRGSQWLKSYMQKLGQILDMAEASQTELEPEMVSKCGEFNEMARALIGKMGEYHKTRYEQAGGGEQDGESESEGEPETATMTKAAKIDAFLNRRVVVPGFVMKAIRTAGESLQGDAPKVDEAREILSEVTKGYFEKPDSAAEVVRQADREEWKQRIARLRKLTK
ncbi:MAG: hypothetical protein E6Q97_30050 [Desulfurellales bacterium]|nr:MAG: hypothetical protein E6Q97_30050 [Desulfurellales bacterium]